MMQFIKKLLSIKKGGYLKIFEGIEDIVSVSQLCKMLHIGKNTAYDLLRNGEIKSVKIGKVYKIPKKCVIEYLENYHNRP